MIPGIGLRSKIFDALTDLSGNYSDYPLTAFRFEVSVAGITSAHFSAVSGINVETAVVPFQEGGNNTFEHKLKGNTKYGNLVLKRGMTTNTDFMEWIRKSIYQENSKLSRQNVIVKMKDDAGEQDVLTWEFRDAWPCKLEGPALDAKQSSAVIETLELAHHGFIKPL